MDVGATYPNSFNDVTGKWCANEIGYLQQFGIIRGYEDGSFRPNDPITRAEFATIACRFEKLTEGEQSFVDVPNSYWAAKYINFASTRGWVTGYSDGTFRPSEKISRAEVVAVTCRLLERKADMDFIAGHLQQLKTYSDVSKAHWAYPFVMEASNGHDFEKSEGKEVWTNLWKK